MAFNPVQFGDWSTRLRRALGLRGDLGFTLAGPAAQPVAVLSQLDGPPFAQVPEYWSSAFQQTAGAAAWSTAEIQGIAGQFVIVDKVTVGGNCFAQMVRNQTPLALTATTLNTATVRNPDPQFQSATATASVVKVLSGQAAAQLPGTNETAWGDLYVDILGPFVLAGPGDWLTVQYYTSNANIQYCFYGRRFPAQD